MAFESLTTAQLETMRDNLVAAINASLPSSGIKKYAIQGLSVERMSTAELLNALRDVDDQLAARLDLTGGVINVVFDDPE